MSPLENCIEELKKYARAMVKNAYKSIRNEGDSDPQNITIIEQRHLLSCYHFVLKKAIDTVPKAYAEEHLKWPEKTWMESVAPKLGQPKFNYIQVMTEDSLRNLSKSSPKSAPSDLNDQKFNPVIPASATLLAGLILKIAASHVRSAGLSVALSTTGIVLLIVGVGGIMYCGYTVYADGTKSRQNKYDVPDDEQVRQVDLTEMLDQQERMNLNVMLKWVEKLAVLAKGGALNAEKIL